MLKRLLMLLFFMGSLLACGENRQETARPEPIIDTEIDVEAIGDPTDTVGAGDSSSIKEPPAKPYGTGENIQ